MMILSFLYDKSIICVRDDCSTRQISSRLFERSDKESHIWWWVPVMQHNERIINFPVADDPNEDEAEK